MRVSMSSAWPCGYRNHESESMMGVSSMASMRQVQAARRNIKKAQQAATRKRTIAKLPRSTRRELGKQAARGRQRRGQAAKMGKWDLIKAIRKTG